jgi:probable addiction module antidote protein
MTKIATTHYDVAEHLRNPEEMAAYLEACFEEADGDAAFIAKALGDIARAKGMSQVAQDAGLSRESLYKAFLANAVLVSIPSSKSSALWVSNSMRQQARPPDPSFQRTVKSCAFSVR